MVIDPEADGGGGAAPGWLESDPIPSVRPRGDETGPQANEEEPFCAPVNAHLHSYCATHFDPRLWAWREHDDTWPWARSP
eukprot:3372939-Rhodomonas_salina.1